MAQVDFAGDRELAMGCFRDATPERITLEYAKWHTYPVRALVG